MWDGIARGYESQYDAIVMFPKQVTVRGALDEWQGRPSGNNIPGFQFTRRDRALKGHLVLQLV